MRYNVFLLFSFNVNTLTVYRQVGLLLTEQRKMRVRSQNGCSHFFFPLQVLLWQHHLECGPPVPVGKTPAHHTCAGPGQPTPRTHTYIHLVLQIHAIIQNVLTCTVLHILHAVNMEQVHWVDLQMMQMRVTYTLPDLQWENMTWDFLCCPPLIPLSSLFHILPRFSQP